jgi:hypothetical protein
MLSPKFIVYCEIGFLEEVYSKIDEPINDFLERTYKMNNRASLYRLLHEHSELVLNLDDAELKERAETDPNLKKILLKSEIGGVFPYPLPFAQLRDEEQKDGFFQQLSYPQALFFLECSPEEAAQIEADYGYICVSDREIDQKIPALFNFHIVSLSRGLLPNSWNFLEKYRLPCNSIVIADNYIVKKGEELDENLFEILRRLMPKSLNKNEFHLTLIVAEDANVGAVYETLQNFFRDTFEYPMGVNLTILKTSKLHNRDILTAYFWINSDYGFTVFKKEDVVEGRETQIKVYPLTYIKPNHIGYDVSEKVEFEATVLQAVEVLRKKYVAINRYTKNIGTQIYVYGKPINRLLQE